jgi:uncharacterized protein YjaZ
MIKLHIANANHQFSATQLTSIRRGFVTARLLCSRLLKLDGVDMIAIGAPRLVIPEIGLGGYTPDPHVSYVYVDTRHSVEENELVATICHELHHASRLLGPGYGQTLLEAMVFEGLAISFEQEATGDETFLSGYLAKQRGTTALLNRVRDRFGDTSFDHRSWFVADAKGVLPRWTGYRVGYYLVQRYLERHNCVSSEVTMQPAITFLEQEGPEAIAA